MQDYIEKKRLSILKIISESQLPIGSHDISLKLNSSGFDISERTVRFHLMATDKEGFTKYLYKKGRLITEGFMKKSVS